MSTELGSKINALIERDNQNKLAMCDYNVSELRKNYNLGLLTERELLGQTLDIIAASFDSMTNLVQFLP